MQGFEFSTARQIVFGAGEIKQVARIALAYDMRCCLVVTGSAPERVEHVTALLTEKGIGVHLFTVAGEPTVELVRSGVQQAAEQNCTAVIAIGGGSVLDAGKAIAALMRNEGDVLEYLEVIGKGRPLAQPGAPWIAVPTTAGTGAEVTKNAVISSPEDQVKVSLRSAWMLPVAAIVDPELALDLPRAQTIVSGMDALTQLIEPYVSHKANAMTDGFCLQGLPVMARALGRMGDEEPDLTMRTDMALGSLLSGLALANAGLGVVHGFAGPLGGMFHAPHGAICAALLPHGMAANIAHLRASQEASATATLERYRTVARCLTGREDAQAEDGVAAVEALAGALQVRPLGALGMTKERADEAVEKAARASSMKANPVTLGTEELRAVYLKAL